MTGYSRWEDAMVEQVRLLDFTTSETGRRFLHFFEQDMQRRHKPEAHRPDGFLQALQHETLRRADPTYVSGDVCDLIDHARETFEPEPVLPSDPWTPNGFVLLPRAIPLDDAPRSEARPFRSADGKVHVRAISWLAIHAEDLSLGTFWISYYAHSDDDLAAGRFTPDEIRAMRNDGMNMSLIHTFQWTWGENPWIDPSKLSAMEDEPPEVTAERGKQQAVLAQALWRIGSQFVPVKQRAPRGIWRDANRKGIQGKDVTVITLRRGRESKDYEPTGRQLHVRHLVRGYWARRHTREGVRQVWVRPHVKGSDDLPFQETTRAWELTR